MAEDTPETRTAFSVKRMDEIGEIYKPQILAILSDIRKEALKRGFTCAEPYDLSDETWRYAMLMKPPGMSAEAEDGVDVTIEVAESYVYGDADPEADDFEDNRNGLNFSLDLCEYGGAIVGGVAPFNYSPQCWVDISDNRAVEGRWDIFTGTFDAETVIDTIVAHYEKQAAKAG